jgi:transcriptional regulator with XRE-family HTH domain
MEQSRWLVEAKTREVKERLALLLGPRGAVSQAARAAQVHRTTVSNWKSQNREAMPDVAEAGLMCEQLGVSLDYLYSGWPSKVGNQQVPEALQDIMVMLMQTSDREHHMVRTILNGAILMYGSGVARESSEQINEQNLKT